MSGHDGENGDRKLALKRYVRWLRGTVNCVVAAPVSALLLRGKGNSGHDIASLVRRVSPVDAATLISRTSPVLEKLSDEAHDVDDRLHSTYTVAPVK